MVKVVEWSQEAVIRCFGQSGSSIVLAMNDDGSRYGSMLSSYKSISQYQRHGYFPFDEMIMRAFLTRVYPIRLASLRIQICPSCKLTRCHSFEDH